MTDPCKKCPIIRAMRQVLSNPSPLDTADAPELTPQENRILLLSARGFSVAEIAERLFISRRTVDTHLTNIKTKIGARDRVDLAKYAMRKGWIDPQDWAWDSGPAFKNRESI